MKQYRLNRLFNAKSGRCFDVAVDHGFFNQPGFLQGIEDMRTVVKTLVDAAPDAIQLTLGMARSDADRIRYIPPTLTEAVQGTGSAPAVTVSARAATSPVCSVTEGRSCDW